MATSNAFQLEDQTDEDFFDKLVDDDFGTMGTSSGDGNVERALSNLSIGDVGSLEDSGDVGSAEEVEEHKEKDVVTIEGSSSLVSLDSCGLAKLPESGELEESAAAEVGLTDSSTGESAGSKGTSVKEVQWSTFSVDSQRDDASGFGSFSEFVTENPDGNADNLKLVADQTSNFAENPVSDTSAYFGSHEQQDAQFYGSGDQQVAGGNDVHYWENLYPGWKYDAGTGQWYQLDGCDAATSAQASAQANAYSTVNGNMNDGYSQEPQPATNWLVSDQKSGVSYLQQEAQSVLQTVSEECTTGSVAHWNQVSQHTIQYPPNMVFDPQYSEWYFDTNTQQWHSLESYMQSLKNISGTLQDQVAEDAKPADEFVSEKNSNFHDEVWNYEENSLQGQCKQETLGGSGGSTDSYAQQNSWQPELTWHEENSVQMQGRQEMVGTWDGSMSSYPEQNMWQPEVVQKSTVDFTYAQHSMWQPDEVSKSSTGVTWNDQSGSFHDSTRTMSNYTNQHVAVKSFEPVSGHGYSGNGGTGLQSSVPAESRRSFNQPKVEQSLQAHLSHGYYDNENSTNFSQQTFQSGNASFSQYSHASSEGRSSAGRPPHALVAFGFGGKLIVMKDVNSFGARLDYGSQDAARSTISVLSLMEVVRDGCDDTDVTGSGSNYFHALCQQSFPGPLVGGSAATKDVNKWVDEKITHCESSVMDQRKGELLKLLLSLLKISCQHYGKLRSPFGTDPSVQDTDGPESALTKLFASARKKGAHIGGYGSFAHCMQNIPSEGQIQKTAVEFQNLLVSGRKKDALQCAQDGQLWGPAIVLAAQLGDKFYVDTVKQMAKCQFMSGSPLRTLCLLIAGQPADVFSVDSSTNIAFTGAINASQQQTQVLANGMLDEWEENLAIIAANRTKDDELVMIHLGDCLWKEKGEVTAAHTCYLVAEANFESFSDTARLCLIGADHWKCPRTYASPEAIQRTELYEYSKVLGNSQFILLPFQPYKLVYAYMLVEMGKVSDSLRYCQASLKLLKNSGRVPEVETWKSLLSSLEERLKTHQQGGYSTNLAPAKLVGKLFTSIDRSIHRMIGAPPAPLPPMPQSHVNDKEIYSAVPKVATSQSTMAMSTLIPSASVEAMSEWTGDSNRKIMHNRSISEPDFGRSPLQDKSKGSPDAQSKASASRFGRIGSQLLQKTVGWVSRSRSDRQAKLGETNKFYYDEKLKRWVEEGAEPPAEEAALPPPPTMPAFHNGVSDYNINSTLKSQSFTDNGGSGIKSPSSSDYSSGMCPIPPSQNQFSARGRMGVRSRYVDTFNKGGGATTNSFQSPSAPSVKLPPAGAKFFIPTAPATSEQPVDATESIHDASTNGAASTPVMRGESISSPPPPPPPSMQRFSSMDNITPSRNMEQNSSLQSGNNSLSSHSRAASWSGSFNGAVNNKVGDVKPLGDLLGLQSSFMPMNTSTNHPSRSSMQLNGGSFGDDLHEVEL